MTRNELQKEVTEWLADLPEADYDAALIVALGPENKEESTRPNQIGFKGTHQEYMDCIGALAENGAKHGYLHKTLKIKP